MRIKRFEEINAWQESRKLVNLIYSAIRTDRDFQSDLRFKSQITSAAVSTMSNIAEGFSRNSNKEFVRFLFIAKGSLAEVQSLLYIAKDLTYINHEHYTKILDQSELTAKYISKFISYLKLTTNKKPTQ